jgi:hypothetical protein
MEEASRLKLSLRGGDEEQPTPQAKFVMMVTFSNLDSLMVQRCM